MAINANLLAALEALPQESVPAVLTHLTARLLVAPPQEIVARHVLGPFAD